MKAIDLTGQVFGRLTVVDRAPNPEHKQTRWNCLCQCGNETIVFSSNLKSGHTVSCGCFRKETTGIHRITHGLSGTTNSKLWSWMKDRCSNPNNPCYAAYGGRGISVCTRWVESLEAFHDDMGERPTPEHSIERQDNDKGYNPCNCYWADKVAQANNTRANRLLTLEGKTLTAAQWARKTGIASSIL